MFENIFNPNTKKYVKIDSTHGFKILENFINQLGGSTLQDELAELREIMARKRGKKKKIVKKFKKTTSNTVKSPKKPKKKPTPNIPHAVKPSKKPKRKKIIIRKKKKPAKKVSQPKNTPSLPKPLQPKVVSVIPTPDVSDQITCTNGNAGVKVFTGGVLTAKNYKNRDNEAVIDPTGWWASEKWDGYRAIWDGSQFLSRNGTPFAVPVWFSALMPPNIALDGELWVGRGCYEKCGIFRRQTPNDMEWIEGNVQFNVFDIPSLDKPFEERMIHLLNLVNERCQCMIQLKVPKGIIGIKCPLQFTPQIQVKSSAHLDKMFNEVIKKGGEGLMIRKPGSKYAKSRSSTLLKYKVLLDTECKIVGYRAGTGKYTGMLGSFECKLLSGNQRSFYVSGMTDEVRSNYLQTHPIDTVITIIYNDLTKNGIPRHPRYLRKRSDYGL